MGRGEDCIESSSWDCARDVVLCATAPLTQSSLWRLPSPAGGLGLCLCIHMYASTPTLVARADA